MLVRPGERRISADATVSHRHRRPPVNRRQVFAKRYQRHRRLLQSGRPARAGFRRRSHCHPGWGQPRPRRAPGCSSRKSNSATDRASRRDPAVFAVPPLWETLQQALLRAMTFAIIAS